jgi:hypothetical protein
MKKAFLFFSLITRLCFSQDYNGRIPEIDDAFEKLDITFPLTGQDKHYEKKDASGRTIYVTLGPTHYIENDSLGVERKQYHKSNESGLIYSYDYSLNPIIGTYKEYHKNGTISGKGIYCALGFKIGKWYSYNKDGTLTGCEDFDEGYGFNYKKILGFCQQNNIPLQIRINGFPGTEIIKYNSRWYVNHVDYQKTIRKVFIIDGNTGQLIEVVEKPLQMNDE